MRISANARELFYYLRFYVFRNEKPYIQRIRNSYKYLNLINIILNIIFNKYNICYKTDIYVHFYKYIYIYIYFRYIKNTKHIVLADRTHLSLLWYYFLMYLKKYRYIHIYIHA